MLQAFPLLPTVEFTRPLVFGALPIALLALWLVVGRRSGDERAGRRERLALFTTRALLATCLVVAAAGPTTVAMTETAADPSVTMLVDESASMSVYDTDVETLESAIEAEGVDVDRVTVAEGTRSQVGDGVIANLQSNGSVLLVSDGRVTDGASVGRAGSLATAVNTSVNRVELSRETDDARVTITGPSNVASGVETTLAVRVTTLGEHPPDGRITVNVDGETVVSRAVPENGTITLERTFSRVGPHRITATLSDGGAVAQNDVARASVEVIEQPRVLYVTRGEYPLEESLRRLYDVTRTDSVPTDLEEYYAVVIQDVAADDLGPTGSLQQHVIDGNGLVVVGGDTAYERGGYENARIASLLPVRFGEPADQRSRIVLAIDISGSAEAGLDVQKALALDVLEQLGDANEVGIVAFDGSAYRVAEPMSLEGNRGELERRIRSLQTNDGGTQIAAGLRGSGTLLGEGGSVVLLSDGIDDEAPTLNAADDLAQRDIRVISVGVGDVNRRLLRATAERTGGSFFTADETNRLRIEFGGPDRRFDGETLVVVDDSHFITGDVEPTASLSQVHEVSVRPGADRLVATGTGEPAISAWRFGLGRVVSVTAYAADGGLGELREQPDSLLLTRSVNWGIGDPRRKATGVIAAPDTRVGEPTSIIYAGGSPPTTTEVSFVRIDTDRYRARQTPTEPGYRTVLDSEYAVNYRSEYAALGQAPALDRIVEQTGGETFDPSEAAAIAETVTQQVRHQQRIERSWDWVFLLIGLCVYVVEVCVRRMRRYRGRGTLP